MRTAAKHENPEPIKAKLTDRETGWVTPVGEYLCHVGNIPMDGPYNLGDIVELVPREAGEPFPWLGRVIYRQYECRVCLFPKDQAEAQFLRDFLNLSGVAVECMVAPVDGRKGLIMVAYREHVDVLALAEKFDIEAGPEELGGDQ